MIKLSGNLTGHAILQFSKNERKEKTQLSIVKEYLNLINAQKKTAVSRVKCKKINKNENFPKRRPFFPFFFNKKPEKTMKIARAQDNRSALRKI